MTETRQTRQENYRIKRANGFNCAECGRHDSILAVREKSTGALTTRCAPCLDARSYEVRDGQWDAAEKLRVALASKRG